jgi:hypothetical protein
MPYEQLASYFSPYGNFLTRAQQFNYSFKVLDTLKRM